MKVSISIVLDTRRELNKGGFPVKLRLTYEGGSRYINTSYSFTESTFGKIIGGKRLNSEEKKISIQFGKIRDRAHSILESMPYYSFDEFKNAFLNKKKSTDLFSVIQDYKDNTHQNQLAKKAHAKALLKHLKKYTGKDTLSVTSITETFITSFINHLLVIGRGTSDKPIPLKENTINHYIAALRTVILLLIKEKRFSADNYPITSKHRLRATPNRSVLTIEEMGLFLNYIPEDHERFWIDIFNFSYLASGMNMSDIFRLKWIDIMVDRFSFIRQKTKRSPTLVTILLTDRLREIINRHGNDKKKSVYVFGCLEEGLTFIEEKKRINDKIRRTNTAISIIAKKLGIDKKVTTYTVRHSYSTILMGNEVPLAFISKQLGHATLTYTQVYLSEFPDHKSEEYAAHLIPKDRSKINIEEGK